MLTALKNSLIIKLLQQKDASRLNRIIGAGLFCGLLQACTLFAIIQGLALLTENTIPIRQFLIFFVSIVGFFFISRRILTQITSIAMNGLLDIRLRIAARLRAITLAAHEVLPETRIQSALLNEQTMVIETARLLIVVLYSIVMIAFSLLQALYISPTGAIYIFAVLVACIATLLFLHKSMLNEMQEASLADQAYCASLNDLLGGYRELKSNRAKTGALFQKQILERHHEARSTRDIMERRYANGLAFFAALALVAVGTILFTLPSVVPDLPSDRIAPLIMLSMAIVMPMTNFVAFIPTFAKSEAALYELQAVETLLDQSEEPFEKADAESNWPERSAPEVEFETLSIHNATFSYASVDHQSTFSIQIDEFTLTQGEIVFLRGGNGSGKTTFMTLLSGLYPPADGEIRFNHRPIEEVGPETYRNLFSIITPEPYLFPILLAPKEGDIERGNQLLQKVHLSKVSIDETGRYSTTNLSAGQRKRLALANAMLENRPILLFDEVAADFDPQYREHFYRTMLPAFKAEGKTVVVISHDDRYFDVADRLLQMHDGRFI